MLDFEADQHRLNQILEQEVLEASESKEQTTLSFDQQLLEL